MRAILSLAENSDVMVFVVSLKRANKAFMRVLMYTCLTLFCINSGAVSQAFADETVYISIIIDDLGYSWRNGRRAVELPGDITYSVLPYTHHSKSLAALANSAGKEVMLHLPMENVRNQDIGPDGLTAEQDKATFTVNLAKALADVPFISGVNNHMGSYLTQQPQQMAWLMEEIQHRQIFFIDSRTTPGSVASLVAQQKNIRESSRDVFLDNDPTFYEIDRAFRELIRIARKSGSAIAIGHPYTNTLAYLEMALPMLNDIGIKLVSASDLLNKRELIASRKALLQQAQFSDGERQTDTGGIAD